MIDSLNSLSYFTILEARKNPRIAREIQLTSPGCSPQELAALTEWNPYLPPKYLSCIAHFKLKGIGLPGWFELWPGSNVIKGTFFTDFKEGNTAGWLHVDQYQKMGLVRVAGWNEEDVCVALTNCPNFPADSVIRFTLADTVEGPKIICRDFEQFLLSAGNVAEILTEHATEPPDSKIEMLLSRLALIGLSPTEVETWREVGEIVYGD